LLELRSLLVRVKNKGLCRHQIGAPHVVPFGLPMDQDLERGRVAARQKPSRRDLGKLTYVPDADERNQ
jgi:hypothetical protein